ncbi:MAG: PilZ domain-containing protein [Bdellovibrionales bacterium]
MSEAARKIEPVNLVKKKPEAPAKAPLAEPAMMSTPKAHMGRRRVPRRGFDSSVGTLIKGEYSVSKSYQVGEGGMMISCTPEMVMNQRLVVSFHLPGNETPIIVGAITRSVIPASNSYPVRYGLEFIGLEFSFKREIRNFVASATGMESS